jgi:hypothetical protein
MTGKLKPGWCEEAGRLAGIAERGGGPTEAITVRRPRLWKAGTRAQQHERNRRAGVTGGANTKLARKLDETLGVADAEGEE